MSQVNFIIYPVQYGVETIYRIIRDDLTNRREVLSLSTEHNAGLTNFYSLIELMGKQIEVSTCKILNPSLSPSSWLVEYDNFDSTNAIVVITI